MNIAYAASSSAALVTSAAGLQIVLCNIFNIMFWLLLSISVLMILVGAFIYATAQGDAEKISQAGRMIMYAAIGIVIALFAKQFPAIIGSFFGKSNLQACDSLQTSKFIPTPE